MDTFDCCAAVIPPIVSARLFNDHRSVCLEEENLTTQIETEVDAAIIKSEQRLYLFECGHRHAPQNAGHIGEEFGFFSTVVGAICHVSAEIVDLPVL